MSRRGGWRSAIAAGLMLGLATVRPASAMFLDEADAFKLTAQFYSQACFRLQNSEKVIGQQIQPYQSGGNSLPVGIGNLVQWRNLGAPVLEGDLNRAFDLGFFQDFSFRIAARLTYDGVFDFGPQRFGENAYRYKANGRANPLGGPRPAPVFQGTKPLETNTTSLGPCGSDDLLALLQCNYSDQDARAARIRNQDVVDIRDQYGQQAEAWEAYVNAQWRRLFVRLGRQNVSWGETDGLRLLDQINPLDNFFGLTFDEDLDEKRIPLWMLRTNYQVIDFWGPFSSVGLETFFVPGIVDTRQGPTLLQSQQHPYAPPAGCDAQLIADNSLGRLVVGDSQIPGGCTEAELLGLAPNPVKGIVKVSFYERLPQKTMENSRYGARFVGVFQNDYTWSLAAYRTYADIPQPRVHYLDTVDTRALPGLIPGLGEVADLVVPTTTVIELTHDKVTIFGGTLSFFNPRLVPGVVRTEVGYFWKEPAYVPILNIGDPYSAQTETFVPTADYLRWVIGYDMFEVNVPWLSETNNLIIIAQWFNSLRLTSDSKYRKLIDIANSSLVRQTLPPVLPDRARPLPLEEDFSRFGLTANPGRGGKVVILPAIENRYSGTWSLAIRAYLMHGKLEPQLVGVAFTEGDIGFLPSATYRVNDNLSVKLSYAGVYGKYSQLGLFRDRDQVGIRVTYQLN
ncbi:MAG: DUF1302 family protein [Candidatus Binatia bacterium]